jgi:serine/threonine protein kinase
MKVLSKEQVIKRKDVEHTKTERNVLRRIRHPFVVQLHFAFQTGAWRCCSPFAVSHRTIRHYAHASPRVRHDAVDASRPAGNKLYMVMDYVQGGDLYFHLRTEKKFPEPVVRLWIAELVLAYGYLHDLNVVFRDLKPENLLLDAQGHLHLADFGLSKQVVSHEQALHTFCGTPYYLAPEIVQVSKTRGYGKAVDWWAVGVLMFELLTGDPPFQGANLQGVYTAIVNLPSARLMNQLRKSSVSAGAQALIISLLNRNPAERLGSGKSTLLDPALAL